MGESHHAALMAMNSLLICEIFAQVPSQEIQSTKHFSSPCPVEAAKSDKSCQLQTSCTCVTECTEVSLGTAWGHSACRNKGQGRRHRCCQAQIVCLDLGKLWNAWASCRQFDAVSAGCLIQSLNNSALAVESRNFGKPLNDDLCSWCQHCWPSCNRVDFRNCSRGFIKLHIVLFELIDILLNALPEHIVRH